MPILLDAKQVTKKFGGLIAVDKVDFVIEQGMIASLIGPNGAGKTTFFNCVTGFYRPEEGSILFDGEELIGLRSDQITTHGIARTFQNIRLFSNMTALENVMVGEHPRMKANLLGAQGLGADRAALEAALVDFLSAGLGGRRLQRGENRPWGPGSTAPCSGGRWPGYP